MGNRTAVVIAHYHAAGTVAPDLVNLVQHLAARVERVVFVSTGISPAAANTLRAHADVVARENLGYDFWSYRVGVERLADLASLDRIVLLNSSFVTLFPDRLAECLLGPITRPRVHGLSISLEVHRHLQSFAVAFEDAALLASRDFTGWWDNMVPISDRQEVISQYEIGMSRYFAEHGWPLEAVIDPNLQHRLLMVGRAIGSEVMQLQPMAAQFIMDLDQMPLNPTHFLWDRLLAKTGIVKLDLLRENPAALPLDRLSTFLRSQPQMERLVVAALA
ncbi:MAG: rhamnan synthesis F family protein [Novosphingobium sp.]|nr:rhamnan synthesis F family protein [Novosphingobium sp.]